MEHLRLEGDALQLREALSNLIDNALRYTPRGSTVTLRVQQRGGGAVLAVEDNGPGLSEADMPHVFQVAPFIPESGRAMHHIADFVAARTGWVLANMDGAADATAQPQPVTGPAALP